MFTLEKYKGSASRHTCPACGAKKKFTRYIDTDTGRNLADNVGRCERIDGCAYHYPPRQYFADNPHLRNDNGKNLIKPYIWTPAKPGIRWQGPTRKNGSQAIYAAQKTIKRPDYIDNRHLNASLTNYEQNSFAQFLLELFPYDAKDVAEAVDAYKVGTKQGFTIFPYIDQQGRVCKGKAMKFGPDGHRLKSGYSQSSLEHLLKAEGKLKQDFETDKRILFGEHLIRKYPTRPIAIVEAPKTAVIGSICKRVFDDYVWLAAGSLAELNADKLARLGRDRKMILFPDTKAFDKWKAIASDARNSGFDVRVSDFIEKQATSDLYATGCDLADYLIAEQQRRNDPANRAAFADLIEERIAIMTFDGKLSEADAENYLETSGFIQYAERCVLESA